jgi:hypothetical protein
MLIDLKLFRRIDAIRQPTTVRLFSRVVGPMGQKMGERGRPDRGELSIGHLHVARIRKNFVPPRPVSRGSSLSRERPSGCGTSSGSYVGRPDYDGRSLPSQNDLDKLKSLNSFLYLGSSIILRGIVSI